MEQEEKLIAKKKTECDPPMKTEGPKMLEIPAFCVSAGNGEGNSSSRCSEPPCTSSYFTNDPSIVVEELNMKNYRIQDAVLLGKSNFGEEMQSRTSQWQHLHQLVGEPRPFGDFASWDKDPILMSAREDLRRMPSNLRNLRPSMQKNQDSEDVTTHLTDRYNKAAEKEPLGAKQSKIVSESSFSQIFGKKTLKGKGVLSKRPETPIKAFDVSVNTSTKNEPPPQCMTQEGGVESFHDAINLREWLKSKSCGVSKDERLRLFRQILELVDFAHSQGVFLQDIRPSSFNLMPSNQVKYTGSSIHRELQSDVYRGISGKRPLEHEMESYRDLGVKQQKLGENTKSLNDLTDQNKVTYPSPSIPIQEQSNFVDIQMEKKWYASPEGSNERVLLSSNVYSLGVLLFELFCWFESLEARAAAMLDLHHRILPTHFLSGNPTETGFCLWLLHPEPSSRPTTRQILQSEYISGSEVMNSVNDLPTLPDENDDESELLLHFLLTLKDQTQKNASKVEEYLQLLEADIKDIERRHKVNPSSEYSSVLSRSSLPLSNIAFSQLENVYFSVRSQTHTAENVIIERSDNDLLRNRDRPCLTQTKKERKNKGANPRNSIEAFFEGLCKFTRYSKFEVCGTIRNNGLLNSPNVICSLSFDRDEDYIASAGVSKKIKVFEFNALLNDQVDIHYPVVEMSSKSKLSCVCWNKYIKNYLASTDYDGVVQMWDANTGQGFSQYVDHQKRAWSVDFSYVDPMKFATGSDDCSVKLWNINERSSVDTIRNPANVCCVQLSPYSSNLLAFGSADYKIYCYDLRNTRIPWCTLAGHGKAVSYIKYIDAETLVSASTDNTLKLWDLNKTSSESVSSDACSLTFKGHTNEKNFVGLSVSKGYIACGSETNEVYAYYKSLPIPVSSHKFGSIDPISGHEIEENSGQFVSSVCWRGKSDMVVAANSSGSMKLLRMV